MNTKLHYYFDMDGVLADFDGAPNAVSRFKDETGFFKGLKPFTGTIERVNRLLNTQSDNVYILTASPHEKADADKLAWIMQYLPRLSPSHFIAVRIGDNKGDYVRDKTAHNVLFDDYGVNVEQWRAHGDNFDAIQMEGQYL